MSSSLSVCIKNVTTKNILKDDFVILLVNAYRKRGMTSQSVNLGFVGLHLESNSARLLLTFRVHIR